MQKKFVTMQWGDVVYIKDANGNRYPITLSIIYSEMKPQVEIRDEEIGAILTLRSQDEVHLVNLHVRARLLSITYRDDRPDGIRIPTPYAGIELELDEGFELDES